jgi:hypothetical protein
MPDLTNFPLLFDRIGAFLQQFDALRKKRQELTPDKFVKEFDKFVKGNSPDIIIPDFKEMQLVLFNRARAICSGPGSRMKP